MIHPIIVCLTACTPPGWPRTLVAQAERDAAGHQEWYDGADHVARINEVESSGRKRERNDEGRNPYRGSRRRSAVLLRQTAPNRQHPSGDDQDEAGEGRRPLNVVDGGATSQPARLVAGHEAHCRFPGPAQKGQVSKVVPPAASLRSQRERQQRQTNGGGADDRNDRATAVRDRGDEPAGPPRRPGTPRSSASRGPGPKFLPTDPGCEASGPEAHGRRSTAPMRKRGRTGRRSALPASTRSGVG